MAKLRQFHLTDQSLFRLGYAPIAAKRFFVGAGNVAHDHDYVEIGIVLAGTVVDFDSKGERTLRRGDGYVIRPGGWHGNHPCRKACIYNCCITAELLGNQLGWMREDPRLDRLLFTGPAAPYSNGIQRFGLSESALRACEAHLDELHRALENSRRRERLDEMSRLCVFLASLAKRARQKPGAQRRDPGVSLDPRLNQALRMLESNLVISLSLSQVARSVGLDPSRLVRLFKDYKGLAPMAYRARQRLEAAASMLLQSDASIAEVGASVGWIDQNYFARRFKAHFGTTPSIYRARFRQSGGTIRDLPSNGSSHSARGCKTYRQRSGQRLTSDI